jgi:hypothetical protein
MRKECTKENPSDGSPWKWYHPDAKFIKSYDSFFSYEDSYDEYECPHCGIIFKETISK